MINKLKQDCIDWISSLTEVIRNEREMQVRLAMYLKGIGYYDNVHVEYPVPLAMLKNYFHQVEAEELLKNYFRQVEAEEFPWSNDIYIDIVVEKAGQFAIVELKYATKAISVQPKVFYQPVPSNIKIIKNQDASNLTMYNYWKDVRRIETLTLIPKVVGGVAIILTNNQSYWNGPRQNPAYSNFSTAEGRTVKGKMTWNTKNNGKDDISPKILGSHPNFQINGSYKCHWKDTNIIVKDVDGKNLEKKRPDLFRYMITEINNDN